ncbi:hypothetical protein ACIQZG_07130 [Lysinibacillus sp. NPDC096418]|uniref:hypothetical protein n=1 Tax=Lysinibacillus sp. NPDC096418 TaxID=3364138 RepID=UPI0037F9D760
MKARLNELDRKMKVTPINYYSDKIFNANAEDDNGNDLTSPEENARTYFGAGITVNMQEALKFPDKNKEYVDALNDLLEESNQYLLELRHQIVEEVLNHNDLRFDDYVLPNLVKEYQGHKDYIDGLASALEVIKYTPRELINT